MVLQASTNVQPTDCDDIRLTRYLLTGPDQHQSGLHKMKRRGSPDIKLLHACTVTYQVTHSTSAHGWAPFLKWIMSTLRAH